MEPVHSIQGVAAPLPRAAIDTDQIVPKQFLKRVERSGYGPFLFYDWAHDVEGEPDPDFVLNRPEYLDARILVAGPSFGCGSSREHATWALQDRGFAAVIAPSFADIFRNNAYNVGLLPIELDQSAVDALLEIAERAGTVTVDLERQTVSSEGIEFSFDIEPHIKENLLSGIDPIGETLRSVAAIDAFEERRPAFRPALTD